MKIDLKEGALHHSHDMRQKKFPKLSDLPTYWCFVIKGEQKSRWNRYPTMNFLIIVKKLKKFNIIFEFENIHYWNYSKFIFYSHIFLCVSGCDKTVCFLWINILIISFFPWS